MLDLKNYTNDTIIRQVRREENVEIAKKAALFLGHALIGLIITIAPLVVFPFL